MSVERLGAVWAFLRARKVALMVSMALVLGGYAIGRYGRPADLHEKTVERIVYKEQEKSSAKTEKHAASEVLRTQGPTTVVRYIYRQDGTVAAKTEVQKGASTTEAHVKTDAKREETHERVVYQDREKIVERTVITSKAPTWILGAEVGASLSAHGGLPLPYHGLVNLTLDRRLFGPVSAGAWVSSSAAAGVRLSVAF